MFWQSRLGVLLKHFFDSRLDTEFCRDDLTHRMILFASIAHSSSCDIRLLLTSEKNCEICERFSDFIHRAQARLTCSDVSLMLFGVRRLRTWCKRLLAGRLAFQPCLSALSDVAVYICLYIHVHAFRI